ncbi:MAG: YtxH domain-containing protein [Ginsengibacter sp.]
MKLSNAALLILTGIAIGAVAGVLLAPEEGSQTSKKLLKKAKKYKKLLEDKVTDYKKKAGEFKDNVEGVAADVKKRFA